MLWLAPRKAVFVSGSSHAGTRADRCLHRLQGDKGTAMDKLRLVLVYLLTAESLPSEDELRPLESALRESLLDFVLSWKVYDRQASLTDAHH